MGTWENRVLPSLADNYKVSALRELSVRLAHLWTLLLCLKDGDLICAVSPITLLWAMRNGLPQ